MSAFWLPFHGAHLQLNLLSRKLQVPETATSQPGALFFDTQSSSAISLPFAASPVTSRNLLRRLLARSAADTNKPAQPIGPPPSCLPAEEGIQGTTCCPKTAHAAPAEMFTLKLCQNDLQQHPESP
ncbi:hypothetical protein CKAH01_04213 [Colletotrichum kahawae]|uniref:Uncharacterized protein n=1 Tax=Colletotrichum kahawae TaxID=34407 RepID=A0AAD9YKX3_COLKA|nr:hypothetical protein CKAH01_04213 [Colletotrichum kahawae]